MSQGLRLIEGDLGFGRLLQTNRCWFLIVGLLSNAIADFFGGLLLVCLQLFFVLTCRFRNWKVDPDHLN